MKPKVNKELCIGCGTCPSICPEVFEMGMEGKAHVKELDNYAEYEEKIKKAVNACPVQAISIEE